MNDTKESSITGPCIRDAGCVDISYMCTISELSDIWRVDSVLGTEELPEETPLQEDDLDWCVIGQHCVVQVILRVIRDPDLRSGPRNPWLVLLGRLGETDKRLHCGCETECRTWFQA